MMKRYSLAAFMILTIVLSACTMKYPQGQIAAVTPSPTSRFTSPLPGNNNMDIVESLATGTALALTAGAGGNPNTNLTEAPVGGTPLTPVTQITFTPTPNVVGGVTATASPIVACTAPPACGPGQALVCASGNCQGGCGMVCAPVTATFTQIPQGAVPTSWTLHEGEFPYCIARRYNLNPEYLLSYRGNEWTNGAPYFAGQVLVIPPASDSQRGPFPGDRALRPHPTTYTVTSSDETFYSIACLFGDVDPAQLAQRNNLSVDASLTAGKVLNIP